MTTTTDHAADWSALDADGLARLAQATESAARVLRRRGVRVTESDTEDAATECAIAAALSPDTLTDSRALARLASATLRAVIRERDRATGDVLSRATGARSDVLATAVRPSADATPTERRAYASALTAGVMSGDGVTVRFTRRTRTVAGTLTGDTYTVTECDTTDAGRESGRLVTSGERTDAVLAAHALAKWAPQYGPRIRHRESGHGVGVWQLRNVRAAERAYAADVTDAAYRAAVSLRDPLARAAIAAWRTGRPTTPRALVSRVGRNPRGQWRDANDRVRPSVNVSAVARELHGADDQRTRDATRAALREWARSRETFARVTADLVGNVTALRYASAACDGAQADYAAAYRYGRAHAVTSRTGPEYVGRTLAPVGTLSGPVYWSPVSDAADVRVGLNYYGARAVRRMRAAHRVTAYRWRSAWSATDGLTGDALTAALADVRAVRADSHSGPVARLVTVDHGHGHGATAAVDTRCIGTGPSGAHAIGTDAYVAAHAARVAHLLARPSVRTVRPVSAPRPVYGPPRLPYSSVLGMTYRHASALVGRRDRDRGVSGAARLRAVYGRRPSVRDLLAAVGLAAV